MKYFALSLCILSFVSAFAQRDIGPNEIMKIVGIDTIYVTVPHFDGNEKMVFIEQMPQPVVKGDIDSFFRKHIRYPVEARRKSIQGTVVVQYLIKINGEIDSLKIIKTASPELDKEAIRVLKLLRWTPGMTSGKNVDVWMTTRVPFKL